jgi:tetratricopeptide (TPR) repeat protein
VFREPPLVVHAVLHHEVSLALDTLATGLEAHPGLFPEAWPLCVALSTGFDPLFPNRLGEALARHTHDDLLHDVERGRVSFHGARLDARLRLAISELRSGDISIAMSEFGRISEQFPNASDPTILMARSLWRADKKRRASRSLEALFMRQARGGAASPEAKEQLALAIAEMLQGLEEYHEALVWTTKVDASAAVHRMRVELRLCLRETNAAQGNLDRAQECFSEAMDRSADSADPYVSLGLVEQRRGDLDNARRLYNDALARDAGHADAHYYLGRIALRRSEIRTAESHLLDALACNPRHVFALNDYAIVLDAQNHLGQAIRHYRRAVDVSPNFTSARINLGSALARFSRAGGGDTEGYENARAQYQDAFDVDPDNLLALLQLSGIQYTCETVELADASFAGLESRQPDFPNLFYYRGLIRIHEKLFVEALPFFLESIRRDPGGVGGYNQACWVLLRGDSKNGLEGPWKTWSGDEISRSELLAALERSRHLRGVTRDVIEVLDVGYRSSLPLVETFAAVESAVTTKERFVALGDEWRYVAGRQDPSNGFEWTLPEFDDSHGSVDVHSDDGLLDIDFRSINGDPTVSAIEVLRK